MGKKLNLIVGVGFVSYFILLVVLEGINYINIMFLLFGLLFVGIYYFDLKYKVRRECDVYIKWRKKALVSSSAILSLILLVNGTMLVFAMNKNFDKTDVVMVLGAGLDGDKVTDTLKSRLDGALEHINNDENYDFILVSGGKGSDELISEAEAMRRYLVDHGVPNYKIVLEDKSTSTFENFKYSKKIIESSLKKEIDSVNVKVFTNNFHTMRSYFIGKRLQYEKLNMYGTKTPIYLAPYYYLREIFAMVKTIIFDK